MNQDTIQTNVDRLVMLVQKKNRISIKAAAKNLNLPISSVLEWAAFLDEEGVFNIEYKFTVPYLVKRILNKKESNELTIALNEEKDIFSKKSESNLNYLNKLEEEISSLRGFLDDLGNHFTHTMSSAKEELDQLRKAEQEKEKLNTKIIETKQKFIKQITDINKHLLDEQKKYGNIYNLLYSESQIENQIIDIQADELAVIQKTDEILTKKLKVLKKKMEKKKVEEMGKKKGLVKDARSNLLILEKKYNDLKKYLRDETETICALSKKYKEQEKQSKSLTEDVIAKIRVNAADLNHTLSQTKDFSKKLNIFMKKKKIILDMLKGISYNEKMLKEKLVDLINKENSITDKGGLESAAITMAQIQEGLDDISKKRGFFETEIKKIFSILRLQ